jgi:hypothetical protein
VQVGGCRLLSILNADRRTPSDEARRAKYVFVLAATQLSRFSKKLHERKTDPFHCD